MTISKCCNTDIQETNASDKSNPYVVATTSQRKAYSKLFYVQYVEKFQLCTSKRQNKPRI